MPLYKSYTEDELCFVVNQLIPRTTNLSVPVSTCGARTATGRNGLETQVGMNNGRIIHNNALMGVAQML